MEGTLILWTKVSALAMVGTGVVLLVTLIFVLLQLRSSGKTQELQGFVQLVGWLQREEVREARRRVYELQYVNPKVWTNEDKWEAEKVCHNFGVVGDMLKKGLISKRVVDGWGWTIKRCWLILKPMVEEYRKDRKYYTRIWHEFQWLAEDVYGQEGGEEQ